MGSGLSLGPMKLFTVILSGSLALLVACGAKKKDVTPESSEGPGLDDPTPVGSPTPDDSAPAAARCDERRVAEVLEAVGATLPEPAAVPSPSKTCRTIATRWLQDGDQHVCAWNGTALTCAAGRSRCGAVRYEYGSARNLVWEGEAIGRLRVTSALSEATPSGASDCDADRRLAQGVHATPGLSARYSYRYTGDALDAEVSGAGVTNFAVTTVSTVRRDRDLRVTLALSRNVQEHRPSGRKGEYCSVRAIVYEPDRIITRYYAVLPAPALVEPTHEDVTRYDDRGIAIGGASASFTIEATEEICAD